MTHLSVWALLGAMGLCVSCLPPKQSSQLQSEASYDDIRWIKKAARALWRERSLPITDEVKTLAAKPRGEAVAEMMQDKRFSESLFDFYLYYLGAKTNEIEGDNFDPGNELEVGQQVLMRRPQATIAANYTFHGKDYTVLFDPEVKIPVLRRSEQRRTESEVKSAFETLKTKLQEAERIITADTEEFCQGLQDAFSSEQPGFQGEDQQEDQSRPQHISIEIGAAISATGAADVGKANDFTGGLRFDFFQNCFEQEGFGPDAKQTFRTNAKDLLLAEIETNRSTFHSITNTILDAHGKTEEVARMKVGRNGPIAKTLRQLLKS